MARIAIITDPDTALGCKLTGVDVYSVSASQEGAGYLDRFLKSREYEIIAYSEEYTGDLAESLRRKIEESVVPIFIAIPSIRSWREGERGEEYLAKVLQKALGFYVKIRR